MAEPFKVERITKGINTGKWGVYKKAGFMGKPVLMMTFSTKQGATMDCNRRNDDAAK